MGEARTQGPTRTSESIGEGNTSEPHRETWIQGRIILDCRVDLCPAGMGRDSRRPWSVDRRWRTTFRILPIAGMIAAYLSVASFSVIYAIRSGNAQQSLKAELDQIKKNTEQPPNI